MSRFEIAFFLLLVILAAAIVVMWFSLRFVRYERELRRGHRVAPVWRPFWLP
jgi:hypothetical protein